MQVSVVLVDIYLLHIHFPRPDSEKPILTGIYLFEENNGNMRIVWNLFKANNKDINMMSLTSYSGFSIVHF